MGLESEATILDRVREDFATSDGTKLLEIFRGWEGAQLEGKVYVNRFKKGSDAENRAFFWDTFQIMIHEYIHSLEHDDYHAYAVSFGEESEQYNTLVEGMCSVLTEIAWTNIVPKVSTTALREKVETPALAAARNRRQNTLRSSLLRRRQCGHRPRLARHPDGPLPQRNRI